MRDLREQEIRLDATVATRLPELLARSFDEPERGDAELERAVRAFVEGERREHTPPERVVVVLKQAAWTAAATTRASHRASNEMADRLVRWFVESYYPADAEAPRATPPSLADAPHLRPPATEL